MRILLIDQYGEAGGAQRVLLEAAGGFAARGWELHAAMPHGPLTERLRPLVRSFTALPCGPFQAMRKTVRDVLRFATQMGPQTAAIRRVVREAGADVLYVNGPRLAPAAACGRAGRPLVFHAHSVVPQRAAAEAAGLALRLCGARVVASSEFVAGWWGRYVSRDRTTVIYNGVSPAGRPAAARSRFTRIGVLGRVAPEKGQLLFVRAARIAAQWDPSLRFVVGGGPVIADAAYLTAVRREAGPEVRFPGWIEDISTFFSEIDLLVVPSESFDANPRVIAEAFSAGVPVLAFDGGGVPELIEHGVSGLLVAQRNPEALAQAMLDAVQAPGLLNAIAEQAFARWQARFTLPRFHAEICEAIEAAVRDHRGLAGAPRAEQV